ncbi:MAG: hypothetical protein Q8P40_00270 [Nitrospirota bacterium]|nr:hypothetical protein [Nitrospirota bacterium]
MKIEKMEIWITCESLCSVYLTSESLGLRTLFVMDGLEIERQRGMNINNSCVSGIIEPGIKGGNYHA